MNTQSFKTIQTNFETKKFIQTHTMKPEMVATGFRDGKEISLTEFMETDITLRSEIYCQMLEKFWKSIQKK